MPRPIRLLALAVAAALPLAALPLIASPVAAAEAQYRFYNSTSSGTAIYRQGASGTTPTSLYGLNPGGSFYSIDAAGAAPANNSFYREAGWAQGITAGAAANRGPIEWILKNSFPVTTASSLHQRVSAFDPYFTTPTLTDAKAIAATQSALLYFSDGIALDTVRYADATAATASSTAAGSSAAALIDANPATGWRAGANGTSFVDFTLTAAVQPSGISISSLEGGSAANAPSSIKLLRVNTDGSTTAISVANRTLSGAGSSATNLFAGGASQTKAWTFSSTSFTAGTTYRLEFAAAGGAGTPVELGGVRFSATSEYRNDAQVVGAYKYLVASAAQQVSSSATAPDVALVASEGRTQYAIAPGGALGPFQVTGNVPAELTLSSPASAKIVDAAGATLSGLLPAGTWFWVQPTAVPALAGSITVTAQAPTVSTTVATALLGSSTLNGTPNAKTLAGLSTTTATDSDALALGWTIDVAAADTFDDTGAATTRDYHFYTPLTASPTWQDIRWSDGTTTTTDLVQLQGIGGATSPSVYSADFAGTTPGNNSYYREVDWAQGGNPAALGHEAEIAWILKNSYPVLSTEAFTAALTASGADLAGANVKNYNAIAATQAAIWHFTNGKDLDTSRIGDPSGVVASSAAEGFAAAAVLDTDAATIWRASAEGVAFLDFTFAAPVELSAYSVTTAAGGTALAAPASWRLLRATDGVDYTPVSSSAVTLAEADRFPGGDAASRRTVLGGSATVGGYAHYRLELTGADAATPVELGGVRFETAVTYRNDKQVVLAYDYLVRGAQAAASGFLQAPPTLGLTASATTAELAEGGRLGPFTVTGSTKALLSVSGSDAQITDEGGRLIETPLLPGATFWVTPASNATGAVTVHAQGEAVNRLAARALIGSAARGGAATSRTLAQLGVATERATADLALSWSPLVVPVAALSPSVSSVAQGGSLVVSGSGYAPGESVLVELHSQPVSLGTAIAGADGTFRLTVVVPKSTPTDNHTLVGVGAESTREARAGIAVTLAVQSQDLSTKALATAGADPGFAVPLAASVVLGGILLLLLRRRFAR